MNENIIRDFAIVAAIGSMLEDEGASELMTDEEEARIDALCDTIPPNPTEHVEVAKRMFREAIDRLLVAEVEPPGTEN